MANWYEDSNYKEKKQQLCEIKYYSLSHEIKYTIIEI